MWLPSDLRNPRRRLMARGCELPEVKAVGEVIPFVVASKNPHTGAYSIATIKRTINPNVNVIGAADITFKVGALDAADRHIRVLQQSGACI